METQTNTEQTYQEVAQNFLDKHGISFRAIFLENAKHFPDDTAKRDIYMLQLTRKTRTVDFRFGQSLANSSVTKAEENQLYNRCGNHPKYYSELKKLKARVEIPTPYDLLASLTKYSPGSFANFCSDFGYDEDSRTAENTQKAVVEEWFKVESFFTPAELEELQEIN